MAHGQLQNHNIGTFHVPGIWQSVPLRSCTLAEAKETSNMILREGFSFREEGDDHDEMWEKVLKEFHAALARAGHTGKTLTKSGRRVRIHGHYIEK